MHRHLEDLRKMGVLTGMRENQELLQFRKVGENMLSDIERKVLRIIGNYSAGRRRFPTIDELCTKTGRNRKGVIEVLEVLHKETYIIWTKEEDELTEFCYRITDSRQFDYALTVSWWESRKGKHGVIETFWGWVVDFDSAYKRIKLKNW